MAEKGRRGKQNSEGERKIKDNYWFLNFKWFWLNEGSWKRSGFWGEGNQEFWFGSIKFDSY